METSYDLDLRFSAGAEPPGQRHLRWDLSHEGCGGLSVIAPSPVWAADVDDGGPTPQMHILALDAQCLCSNVSGQQSGIPSDSCMQRHSFCWLLQQLAGCVPPQSKVSVNSTLRYYALVTLKGLVVEGVLVGILFLILVTVSW